MDEAALHALLSGSRNDAGARLLRAVLFLASGGYCTAMMLRNLAYDWRLLPVHRASVPVISLGNITTGGTGKTPTAAWLANWLTGQGCDPGLLSRGYRTLAQDNRISLSPDATGSITSRSEFSDVAITDAGAPGNDEKRVLDRLCPGVPHLQHRDRVASAKRLVDDCKCNVLILDDGFQHRRLHRDLDLVLIDAMQPWGYRHLLPRGLLRERLAGLNRASLILITRADQCSEFAKRQLREELILLRGTAECVETAFKPRRLVGLDGTIRELDFARSRKTLGFCGIGNPGGFRQTLLDLGVTHQLQVYPDHHHYHANDFVELAKLASAASAEICLTTLKDLVKIPMDSWTGPPLFAIDIGLEFLSGQELLMSRLLQLTSTVSLR